MTLTIYRPCVDGDMENSMIVFCRAGFGMTENAGRETNGRSKSRDMKMQDMKMQDRLGRHLA